MEENKEVKQESKFKRYLLCLKKGWLIIVILSVIGLLTGLIIANKTFNPKYEEISYSTLNFRYKVDVNINYNDIISENNINRCKNITKSLETGSKISTYKYVELKDYKIIKKDGYYTLEANMDSFNVSQDYSYNDAAAKGFLKHLTLLPFITDTEIEEYNNSTDKGNAVFTTYFDNDFYKANSLVDNKLITRISDPNAASLNQQDRAIYYTIWIASLFTLMLVVALVLIYIFIDKLNKNIKKEYDNKNIYRTPFHKSFFNDSLKVFKNLKSLVMIALLLGLVMVCKFIPIPSGFGELGLGFSFLFLSVACMLFGPYPALVIGILSDVLGYMVRPDGPFFIGYTIQAMVACFAYALCFHKTYVTFTRCLVARVIVNFLCNVIIGTISRAIMYSMGYDAFMTYLLTVALPKNIIYLLPQSLLLFFVLKAVSMPLYHMNLMDERISTNFSFF